MTRLAFGWLSFSTVFAVSQAVDSFLEGVVLFGAAVAAAAVIWAKVVRPAAAFIARAAEAIEEIFELRKWRSTVDDRLAGVESQLESREPDVTVRHEHKISSGRDAA